MPEARPRLGVLGGSFDPPHVAHLVIASEAFSACGLERVVFVPAAAPPHKGDGVRTDAAIRLELTTLAIDGDLRFTASGIEMERDLVYTADTLRGLSDRYDGHELVFIMGTDSLLQLQTWHVPEELLSLCTLAVAPRPGDVSEAVVSAAKRWGEDRVELLDSPAIAISSSEIRERVAQRRPIRYLVPPRVEEYIHETRLYR